MLVTTRHAGVHTGATSDEFCPHPAGADSDPPSHAGKCLGPRRSKCCGASFLRQPIPKYPSIPFAASRPSNTAVTTRSDPRTMSPRRIPSGSLSETQWKPPRTRAPGPSGATGSRVGQTTPADSAGSQNAMITASAGNTCSDPGIGFRPPAPTRIRLAQAGLNQLDALNTV